MSHITDAKRDSMLAIVGGTNTNIDNLEILYLQAAGATSDADVDIVMTDLQTKWSAP
jgi:hypothetical protein